MGSGNFFNSNLVSPVAHWLGPKVGLFQPGRQMGPNGGPYAGVAPSLAGANAGYGGAVQPGANPYAAATPVNPYARAAQQAGQQ